MTKSLYLLATCLFITLACAGQDCNNIPQTFTSPEQATQMVKSANFRIKERLDTQKSSWIRSAIYYSCDGKSGFFLLVTKAGREYLFQDMPINMWRGFKNAQSHGQFYNQHIRNRYQLKIGTL